MEFKILDACKLPFTGRRWFLSLLIGMGLGFIAPLLAPVNGKNIITALIALLIIGFSNAYISITIHNELNNKPRLMPDWDIVKGFIVFCKTFVVNLAYIIVLFPLMFALIYFSFTHRDLVAFVIILAIVIGIFLLPFIYYAQTSFLKEFKIGAAFNFPQIVKLYKAGFGYWYAATGFSILLGIGFGIVYGIFLIIVYLPFGISLINSGHFSPDFTKVLQPSFDGAFRFLLTIIFSNIYAQGFKMAENKLQGKQDLTITE